MIRMLGMARVIRVLAPATVIIAVIPVVPVVGAVVARTIAPVADVWRRNDAEPADVAARYTTTTIVVHRAFVFSGHETFTARPFRAPVLKDETRLWAIRADEYDATAAVVPIRIVPRIIIHIHTEANARGVVRIPGAIAHVGVAVIAKEARVFVVLADIV
jgi:hypothetical protein